MSARAWVARKDGQWSAEAKAAREDARLARSHDARVCACQKRLRLDDKRCICTCWQHQGFAGWLGQASVSGGLTPNPTEATRSNAPSTEMQAAMENERQNPPNEDEQMGAS